MTYKARSTRISKDVILKKILPTTCFCKKQNDHFLIKIEFLLFIYNYLSIIFVGPGAYNHFDNNIYFATTDGFYRASIPNEGRIENPELIFKPELLWDREPLAIGVSMSVKRLVFTDDNRLFFLTSNNGIGIYDGKELKMIR